MDYTKTTQTTHTVTVKLRYSSKQQHSHGLHKNNSDWFPLHVSLVILQENNEKKNRLICDCMSDRQTDTHTHTQEKERKESVQKETGGIQCDYLPQELGHQYRWRSLCSHRACRPRSWTGSWCLESAALCWLKSVCKQACKCISNQNGKMANIYHAVSWKIYKSQMSFKYFTVKNKAHVNCVKIKL